MKIAILKVVKMNQIFQFILVQVHPKSELSSVQVHLAKKWTKFSSSSPKKWTFELNWTFLFSSSTSLLFLPVPEKCFKFALFYTFSEPNLNCNAECSLASGLLALFICCGISTCTTSMLTAVSLFKHPHFLARCENIFRNFELIRQ